jgi:DNA-binding CsgD family transcriptional regulator
VIRCQALLLYERGSVSATAKRIDNLALRSYFENAVLAYSGTADFTALDTSSLPESIKLELPYYAAVNVYNGGKSSAFAWGDDNRSQALRKTIEGYGEARKGNHAKEAALLFEAAELFKSDRVLDVPRYLHVLHEATSTAFELGLPNEPAINPLGLLDMPREQHDIIAAILRRIACSRWACGRITGAFALLRDARSLRISPQALAAICLDTARIAWDEKESNFAFDQIDTVRRMDIDWAMSPPSFLTSIITYAYCVAKIDPHEAKRLLDRSRFILPSPNAVIAKDGRLDALWSFGAGMVASALNQTKQAKVLLQSSYERFDRVNHHFRAARSALEMARIEDREMWLKRARLHALVYGVESPLLAQADAIEEADFGRLSTREKEVARGLLKGESRKQIATRMALEPVTVRNTIYRMYDKTGTRSETGLIVKLQKCLEL